MTSGVNTKRGGRRRPTSRTERRLMGEGYACVAGLDEVGRGAWAGPVSVGAVVWDERIPAKGVRDSKMLSPGAREQLSARLRPAVAHGVGHASPTEIDDLGMTSALRLAAFRALQELSENSETVPDVVIIDGTFDFLAGVLPVECVVAADARCTSVAAASIIAKVTRDRIMVAAHDYFPEFEFASNKGYPSPPHRRELRAAGPSAIHRHTWMPVRSALGLEAYQRGALVEAAFPQTQLF